MFLEDLCRGLFFAFDFSLRQDRVYWEPINIVGSYVFTKTGNMLKNIYRKKYKSRGKYNVISVHTY